MSYTTETMDRILTSEEGRKLVQMVAPIYGDSETALWIYQGIGAALDQLLRYLEEYKQQIFPQSATWSLELWERTYRIIPDPTWTLERRRENVLNKKRKHGAMNPARLADIISVYAGQNVRIEEHTDIGNEFTVIISALPDSINELAVRREVDRAKPAHLIYHIIYENSIPGQIFYGGYIQQAKKITMKQV